MKRDQRKTRHLFFTIGALLTLAFLIAAAFAWVVMIGGWRP